MKNSYSRAFTLIEMLVVIAIIGILTGILVTSLAGSKAKSRDAKRVSDLNQIQLALELYYDRCRTYPSANNGEVDINSKCLNDTVPLTNYISQIPRPPANSQHPEQIIYMYTPNGNSYTLSVFLENDNEVLKDGSCSDRSTLKYCIGPQ